MVVVPVVALLLAAVAAGPVGSAAGEAVVALKAGGIEVSVTAGGSYTLSVDGVHWLRSSPPMLLPGVPLRLAQSASISGKDELGAFNGLSLYWERTGEQLPYRAAAAVAAVPAPAPAVAAAAAAAAPDVYPLQTLFKAYIDTAERELFTFTQIYPAGIAETGPFFNASKMARI